MGDVVMPPRLGRYEAVIPIASDDRACVYVARVHGTEEPYFALKLFPPPAGVSATDFGHALIQGTKPILSLRHRNVVRLVDTGECERGTFLVMDYVPGDSLATLARDARRAGKAFPDRIALRLLRDLLEGLRAIHEHTDDGGRSLALVHRGLSARDVLVGTDGVARVTGFGVALASAETSLAGEPWRGRAPEQVAGGVIDRRSDVWAAGAIAWELFAGTELPIDAMATASSDGPPRVDVVAPAVPRAIADAIAHALRPDPGQRPADAASFAGELETAGRAAEPEEVAGLVGMLADGRLAERRSRLAEARRLQQTRPASMPDVRTMIGGIAPPNLKRLPLADLPAAPAAYDDGASELRIAIPHERRPADRADIGVLGAPSVAPPEEEPAVVRSPLAIPGSGGLGLPSLPAVLGRLRELRLEHLRDLREPIVRFAKGPWTTTKISVVTGIGGGLTGLVLVLALTGKSKDAKLADADGGATSTTIAAAEPTTPAAAGKDGPAPAASDVTDDSLLHLQANSPIASVQVGGRVVDSVVPAPTVALELSGDERDAPLHLVVTATDGRVATLTTNPGDVDVEIIFPDSKPRPSPHRPHPPATPTRRPKR